MRFSLKRFCTYYSFDLGVTKVLMPATQWRCSCENSCVFGSAENIEYKRRSSNTFTHFHSRQDTFSSSVPRQMMMNFFSASGSAEFMNTLDPQFVQNRRSTGISLSVSLSLYAFNLSPPSTTWTCCSDMSAGERMMPRTVQTYSFQEESVRHECWTSRFPAVDAMTNAEREGIPSYFVFNSLAQAWTASDSGRIPSLSLCHS